MAPGRAGWGVAVAPDVDEDVVVRQYRYLLTTASVDALEGIHVEVLGELPEGDHERLLRAVTRAFSTGSHITARDVTRLSHLIAVGAHRSPTAWLDGLGELLARNLAEVVLASETTYGRFNGYVGWDGSSPEPVEPAGPNDGFDPTANRHRLGDDPGRFALAWGIGV